MGNKKKNVFTKTWGKVHFILEKVWDFFSVCLFSSAKEEREKEDAVPKFDSFIKKKKSSFIS